MLRSQPRLIESTEEVSEYILPFSVDRAATAVASGSPKGAAAVAAEVAAAEAAVGSMAGVRLIVPHVRHAAVVEAQWRWATGGFDGGGGGSRSGEGASGSEGKGDGGVDGSGRGGVRGGAGDGGVEGGNEWTSFGTFRVGGGQQPQLDLAVCLLLERAGRVISRLGTKYCVRCRGSNQYGDGGWSEVLDITIPSREAFCQQRDAKQLNEWEEVAGILVSALNQGVTYTGQGVSLDGEVLRAGTKKGGKSSEWKSVHLQLKKGLTAHALGSHSKHLRAARNQAERAGLVSSLCSEEAIVDHDQRKRCMQRGQQLLDAVEERCRRVGRLRQYAGEIKQWETRVRRVHTADVLTGVTELQRILYDELWPVVVGARVKLAPSRSSGRGGVGGVGSAGGSVAGDGDGGESKGGGGDEDKVASMRVSQLRWGAITLWRGGGSSGSGGATPAAKEGDSSLCGTFQQTGESLLKMLLGSILEGSQHLNEEAEGFHGAGGMGRVREIRASADDLRMALAVFEEEAERRSMDVNTPGKQGRNKRSPASLLRLPSFATEMKVIRRGLAGVCLRAILSVERKSSGRKKGCSAADVKMEVEAAKIAGADIDIMDKGKARLKELLVAELKDALEKAQDKDGGGGKGDREGVKGGKADGDGGKDSKGGARVVCSKCNKSTTCAWHKTHCLKMFANLAEAKQEEGGDTRKEEGGEGAGVGAESTVAGLEQWRAMKAAVDGGVEQWAIDSIKQDVLETRRQRQAEKAEREKEEAKIVSSVTDVITKIQEARAAISAPGGSAGSILREQYEERIVRLETLLERAQRTVEARKRFIRDSAASNSSSRRQYANLTAAVDALEEERCVAKMSLVQRQLENAQTNVTDVISPQFMRSFRSFERDGYGFLPPLSKGQIRDGKKQAKKLAKLNRGLDRRIQVRPTDTFYGTNW